MWGSGTEAVLCCSVKTGDLLHDCFESVDWFLFDDSTANLHWYDTGVTGFICKCAEDSIPAKSIRVLPNQETMNREIHYILKFKPEGFMLSDPNLHRKSRYNLHCTIRDVKRQFKIKNMLHLERGWGQAESLVTARSPSMRSILCLFLAGLWNYIALPTTSGASMVPVTDVKSAVTWMNRARN